MDALPTIKSLKVDVRIKNRANIKRINTRHQHVNSVGERFVIPENCQKSHPHKNKNMQCCRLTQEDIVNFRNEIYKTIERKIQDDFLANYLRVIPPKSHSTNLQFARLMSIFYNVPNTSGELIPVCKEMFMEATAMPRTRIQIMCKKVYKNTLLLNGDAEQIPKSLRKSKHSEIKEKIVEILNEKKEKLLSLEKGTYKTFVQAISGKSQNEDQSRVFSDDEDVPLSELHVTNSSTKKSKSRKPKIKRSCPDKDDKRNLIDLNSLEVCRICLQKNEILIPLHKNLEREKYKPADLVKFCFSVKFADTEEMPSKICYYCLNRLRDAYRLKRNCLESRKIMDSCLEDRNYFKIKNDFSAHEEYKSQFTEIEESITETEELMNEEDFILEDEVSVDEFFNNIADDVDDSQMELKPEETEEVESETEPEKYKSVDSGTPRKCYLCDVDFETTAEDHFATVHTLIQISRCSKCEFETEYPWFMNLHYQVHADDIKLCPHCGRKFDSVNDEKFIGHKYWCGNREAKKRRRYKCPHCDIIFKQSTSRKNHIRKIHTQEKPFLCTQCTESFMTKIGLRRHLLKHGIGAKYFCSKCGKGYIQNYELMRHQKNCLT